MPPKKDTGNSLLPDLRTQSAGPDTFSIVKHINPNEVTAVTSNRVMSDVVIDSASVEPKVSDESVKYPDLHDIYPYEFPAGFKVDVGALKEKIKLQQEAKIDLPKNIFIETFLLAHNQKKDALGLKDKVRQSDIVIPESSSYTPTTLDLFRKIAKGDSKAYSKYRKKEASGANFSEFMDWEMDCLYGTNKSVLLVDVPTEDEYASLGLHLDQLPVGYYIRPSLEQSLEVYTEIFQTNALLNRYRENVMLANLNDNLPELVAQHPKLRDKNEVKVLMWLGSTHIDVYNRLASELPEQTTISYGNREPIYTHSEELVHKYMSGEPIDADFVAKSYMDSLLAMSYEMVEAQSCVPSAIGTVDSDEVMRIRRQFVEELDLSDIEQAAKDIYALTYQKIPEGEPVLPQLATELYDRTYPSAKSVSPQAK